MNRLAILAKKIVTPDTIIQDGVVLVERPKILEVGTRLQVHFEENEFRILHCEQQTLVPGFIDVHIHGGGGRDVMEGTREALEVISRILARHGTTSYLATTVTASPIATIRAVESLGNLMDEEIVGARVIGLHLEGPFINEKKRGVHPPEHIRKPSIRIFDELLKMSSFRVRLITLAPEIEGALELIRNARAKGVLVSMGHSNATLEEAIQAINAGVTQATHTFNAMRDFSHRDPGIVGAILTNLDVWAEIIADGVHVDPAVVNILLKCKGFRKILLVTDAISATEMPDGQYQLGSLNVVVSNGVCRVPEGQLAGSTLTQDRALRNMVSWTGLPLEEAVYVATQNPARAVGVDQQKGSLRPGYDADLVLLDDDYKVHATICEGRIVYHSGQTAD
jgi:N-acetylglucosamine-6-phosphate deacetylase